MNRLLIKPNTYVYLTLLFLIIPARWVFSWMIAIVFHEMCHILAVRACNGSIYNIQVGVGGAEIQCELLSKSCELFALLCGPIGGLILVCLGKWCPRIALCSFLLSVYNLLPLLPLDGGRVIRILLKSDKIFNILQNIILIFIMLFASYMTFFLHLGAFPLLVVLGIYIRNRNCPCKESFCRVQ